MEGTDAESLRLTYICDDLDSSPSGKPWSLKLEAFVQKLKQVVGDLYAEHAAVWKATLQANDVLMQTGMQTETMREFMQLVEGDCDAAAMNTMLAIAQDPSSKSFYMAYKTWATCRDELKILAVDPTAKISLDDMDLEQRDANKHVASMTIVQSLQRPLKQNESRMSLAKKCRSLIWAKGWEQDLPVKMDLLLTKAHGEMARPAVDGAQPSADAGASA